MVSALPVFLGLALYWIDPELMSPMFERTIGLVILCVMGLMECLGYFFIYKITNIEV